MRALSRNRIIAAMIALVVFIAALCTYSSNVSADSSTRAYWRHDYSDTDLESYDEYSLTTSSLNNMPKAVIGTNDMVRDYDSSVVRLSTGGTGFIVGDHVIATAAHCVFNNDTSEFLEFTITILNSNITILATIEPKYIHIPAKYLSHGLSYDYALIYVEEDISEYGMFNMGTVLDSYISNNGNVTVSGYPQEYPEGFEDNVWGIRFKATGQLTENTSKFRLYYNADTAGGVSGGPVYVNEAVTSTNGTTFEAKTVIAIHTSGTSDTTNGYNKGVKITSHLLNFYYANAYKTA